ncbi:hypothetical protein [Devosia lacusdianchii]|uniref:hypothetical protein n=1 Tax=Devosia lacusdianchii TaxID=2917991 RepID=UPI001F064DBB|nr:hypothetical protein [Devosia sp. JXJ CY 41]
MKLSDAELKLLLQADGLQRIDRVLLTLAAFSQPASVKDIRSKAGSVGCNMVGWNISDIIARAKGVAIQINGGYELSEKGKAKLPELGATWGSPAATQVAIDLRTHLAKITDKDTRNFVEEAIACYEARLFRSAIVMSWLAALDVIKKDVVKSHLSQFNAEAKRIDAKWKVAVTADDIGVMKEADFLNRLVAISVLGKNTKQRLEQALTLRNGAGHPNSLQVGPNEVAAHIEALLRNVFEVFSP